MTSQRADGSGSVHAPATRRGSFLLVCIIMMSLMVIIGFAVLRNIQTQTDASTSNQRVLLAQSAAQAGLVHATEAILRDYASPTVKVGSDAGGLSGMVDLPARQFLHGPFRVPFLAIDAPDKPDYDHNAVDPTNADPLHHNAPDADKDVRTEHHLARPWERWGWADYHHYWNGTSHMSGRARYYEPNWYNMSPQADGQIKKVPFNVIDPPQVAAPPERAEGIFYDEHFRRITEPDPVKARYAARYRLRYANDVEDLSGLLLINPMADMKLPDDYRNPPLWVQRAGDALATMMTTNFGSLGPNNPWMASHVEHVFLGRGWASNTDLGVGGFPTTFPLMYRYSNPGDQYAQWETYQTWWGSNNLANNLYTSPYVKGKKDGGETLFIRGGGGDRVYSHSLMGPQMSSWNFQYATEENGMDRWGGDINANSTLFASTPFGRSLRQPTGYPATYHPAKRKWYEGRVNTPFYVNIMTAPPWVIDGMLVAYLPPKFKVYKYTWIQFVKYLGKNADGGDMWDWGVPGSGMPIDGSNPANNSYQYGRDLLVDTTSPAFNEFPAPYRDDTTNPPSPVNGEKIKPDYYVFDRRLPHKETDPLNPAAQIDVSMPGSIYPGIAWNGDPAKLGEGGDDAGASMNSDDLGYGVCTHTGQPFVHLDPSPPGYGAWDYQDPAYRSGDPVARKAAWEASQITVEAPAWWVLDTNNRAYKSPDAKRLKFQDSYWWDLYCSMAIAISVMRAQWNQIDNGMTVGGDVHDFDIKNLFPAGLRDPARYQSIRDLDRQFLAELGESIDAPGTGAPDALTAAGRIQAFRINWRAGWPWGPAPSVFMPWTAKNNIKSAMDADLLKSGDPAGKPGDPTADPPVPPTPPGGMTSQERAKSLERVLNDWRMAFFGASPEYSDGIDPVTGIPDPLMEFRPLDFDGDGIVHCSCYQNLAGAPVLNPGAPAEGAGRGPKPDARMYFAPTGTFFVGKSHYYRVVTRGELWDNRFHTILNEACLESVLCVDPEGNNIKDTHTLFQRWNFDKYQGQLSHIRP